MRILLLLCFVSVFIACNDDDVSPQGIPVPETYSFERGGESSVDYSGQNDRLNQVEEIKSKLLAEGDKGNIVTEQALLDAYENAGGNGGGVFSFSSTKQLRDKTFQPDLDEQLFENIFAELAAASIEAQNGTSASNGQAGLIVREGSGKTILVDAHGREFTQLVEKGLMGAVFYHQIYNVYLTEQRIGDDVENDIVREGQTYTDMEHHWDEAFGYFNPPLDFRSAWPEERNGETRFWSRYSNTVDDVMDGQLGTNSAIMNAFLEGRTAIVNKDYAKRDESVQILYDKLDLLAAGVAVHYINSTLGHLNAGNTGESFHALTEAWAFVNALRYNPSRRMTISDIETIMESDFGVDGNFWNVTALGLNKAKNTIVAAYPELEAVKDAL